MELLKFVHRDWDNAKTDFLLQEENDYSTIGRCNPAYRNDLAEKTELKISSSTSPKRLGFISAYADFSVQVIIDNWHCQVPADGLQAADFYDDWRRQLQSIDGLAC